MEVGRDGTLGVGDWGLITGGNTELRDDLRKEESSSGLGSNPKRLPNATCIERAARRVEQVRVSKLVVWPASPKWLPEATCRVQQGGVSR